MAAQGRKNVHGKAGVRFKAGYTASKNKAMLRNVVTDLILIGEVKVTSGVVRELKQLADHLVTLGKKGDLHARRLAAQILRTNVVRKDGRDALDVLFNDIAKPRPIARAATPRPSNLVHAAATAPKFAWSASSTKRFENHESPRFEGFLRYFRHIPRVGEIPRLSGNFCLVKCGIFRKGNGYCGVFSFLRARCVLSRTYVCSNVFEHMPQLFYNISITAKYQEVSLWPLSQKSFKKWKRFAILSPTSPLRS